MRSIFSLLVAGFISAASFAIPANAAEKTAIFAGGCFWCVESDFDHVDGVTATVSGYIGGNQDNPTYKTHGSLGHLEAVQITYDDTKTDFRTLVDTFWRTVDVRDDGGQFCDRGNSYRTAVYTVDEMQAEIAEASKADAESALGDNIKTRIIAASTFWPAEEYHQDFYQKSSSRYKYYRKACGRDRRVKSLWGDEAYVGVNEH